MSKSRGCLRQPKAPQLCLDYALGRKQLLRRPLVNDDRVYRALDELLPLKEQLEQHLKARLGELFKLDYDLLLYDVTSTYFEGQVASNPEAKRGYSRDHRPDCKQLCIALVVTKEGVPWATKYWALLNDEWVKFGASRRSIGRRRGCRRSCAPDRDGACAPLRRHPRLEVA